MKALGGSCAAAHECLSGFCADGVCCDSDCTATCSTCALTGKLGTCSFTPNGQKDPPGCNDGRLRCNGAGLCQ